MRLRRLALVLTCAAFIGCDNAGAPTAPSAPSGATAVQPPPETEKKPEKGKRGEKPSNTVSGTVD